MSDSPSPFLALPEAFVLLSHRPSGTVHGSLRAAYGAAAAELGELTLRRRIRVLPWRTSVLGLRADVTHRAVVELVDTTATGLPWADEALAELSRTAAPTEGRVRVKRWLAAHQQAFSRHRVALTERGVLHERHRTLGRTRRSPDPAVLDALSSELRAIGAGHRPVDARGLFLCDLIRTVGLHRVLRVPTGWRTTPYRSRGAGSARSVPQELRDASSALTALIPSRESQFGGPRR